MEKCKCDLRTRAVGDGCRYCNTTEWIENQRNPTDLWRDIERTTEHLPFLTDLSNFIADDVYGTFLEITKVLSQKIDDLNKEVTMLRLEKERKKC